MSDEPQSKPAPPPPPAYDPEATIPPTLRPAMIGTNPGLPGAPLPADAKHLPDDGQDKSRAGSSQQRESAGQTPGGQLSRGEGRATDPGLAAASNREPTTVPPLPGPPIDFAMPAPNKPISIPPYAGCLVKMIFGFGVLLVIGYCALIALNPKARQWATKGAKDGSGGPTPFKVMNQILAIPAQVIGKTKDVVAASDARTNLVNGVVAEEEARLKGKSGSGGAAYVVTDPFAPKTPAAGANKAAAADDGPAAISRTALLAMAEKQTATSPPPAPIVIAQPKAPAPPTVVKLGGGIVIASASPEGAPVASQPFLFWVVGLNISGVFQSSPHRILMNNRLVYEGTEANPALGITFERLDLANKLIVFHDKTGAVVTRSY